MGPYIVLGDGQRTDRLAVLDAYMSAKGQWSGLQVFVNGGKPADLRSTAAITIPIRVAVNTGTSTKIYFQAGTLSENFDGTGAIRAIQYQSLPSLAFFNQSQGVTQYFPIPENANWGNDGLGTGTTVPDGALLTHELTSSDTALSTALDPTRTDWQVLRLRLTAQERQLLQQVHRLETVDHAVRHVRIEEGRVLRRDDDVDLAEHVQGAATRHAVDRRDHRLPEIVLFGVDALARVVEHVRPAARPDLGVRITRFLAVLAVVLE